MSTYSTPGSVLGVRDMIISKTRVSALRISPGWGGGSENQTTEVHALWLQSRGWMGWGQGWKEDGGQVGGCGIPSKG